MYKGAFKDIIAWHRRNYPNETATQALIGIEEEIGELNRAELKQAGGIRGTWEYWQEEKKKEIGDVLIGIINFCGYYDCVLSSIYPYNWKFPSKLEWISTGLDDLKYRVIMLGIESIAIPALGCNNGQLSWTDVRPLIMEKLNDLEIPVLLYEPQ